jgi:large subunit ribosomal protein L29
MAKAKKAKEVVDYRSMDDQTLAQQSEDEKMRLKKLHFSHAVNPIENPQTIRTLRRTIARIKTEQRRRVLGF